MMKTTSLFVGNVPWAASNADLLAVMKASGGDILGTRVIIDRATGNSKGIAFVEVAGSDEDVERIVAATNGADCCGRKLRVSVARRMR